LSLAAILAACAGTQAAPPLARGTSSAAPVCVGSLDCMTKMNAARNWIAANSGLGLIVDSEDTLETGGWGMPNYTSVRVERRPIGEGRFWIIAAIQCGNGGGQPGLCPDTAAALANFNTTVSAAF
ncbi:MAG: hypothetical protein RL120_03565, partial [Gammaproteobacteria bacterium]